MGYQQTLMYGSYSKALGDYAREEAKRQKILDKQRKRRIRKSREEMTGVKTRGKTYRTTSKVITYVWKHTFAKLGKCLSCKIRVFVQFLWPKMDLECIKWTQIWAQNRPKNEPKIGPKMDRKINRKWAEK